MASPIKPSLDRLLPKPNRFSYFGDRLTYVRLKLSHSQVDARAVTNLIKNELPIGWDVVVGGNEDRYVELGQNGKWYVILREASSKYPPPYNLLLGLYAVGHALAINLGISSDYESKFQDAWNKANKTEKRECLESNFEQLPQSILDLGDAIHDEETFCWKYALIRAESLGIPVGDLEKQKIAMFLGKYSGANLRDFLRKESKALYVARMSIDALQLESNS